MEIMVKYAFHLLFLKNPLWTSKSEWREYNDNN